MVREYVLRTAHLMDTAGNKAAATKPPAVIRGFARYLATLDEHTEIAPVNLLPIRCLVARLTCIHRRRSPR